MAQGTNPSTDVQELPVSLLNLKPTVAVRCICTIDKWTDERMERRFYQYTSFHRTSYLSFLSDVTNVLTKRIATLSVRQCDTKKCSRFHIYFALHCFFIVASDMRRRGKTKNILSLIKLWRYELLMPTNANEPGNVWPTDERRQNAKECKTWLVLKVGKCIL